MRKPYGTGSAPPIAMRFGAKVGRASADKTQRGFTLLETLVTAGIAGTLAAVTFPGMSSALNSHRLTAGLRSTVGVIRVARSSAVTRNVPSRVAVSGDGKTLTVQLDPSGANTWDRSIGTPLVLDGGVTVASPADVLVVFTPKGTVANAVTVTLRNARGDTHNIAVGLIGSVDIS
jgi:prepilin-type N-terminal cleavage/methylation domain-containing protein